MIRRPPRSTLSPYTTLSRSHTYTHTHTQTHTHPHPHPHPHPHTYSDSSQTILLFTLTEISAPNPLIRCKPPPVSPTVCHTPKHNRKTYGTNVWLWLMYLADAFAQNCLQNIRKTLRHNKTSI